jgi:hypothetical protein
VNRFQILKGLPPPPVSAKKEPKKYFYGVDYGPRPESTGIAICHKKDGIIIFEHANLMSGFNHTNLRECLAFLNNTFPIGHLCVDAGPYRENLTGIGYNQKCTEEMIMVLRNAISNGHVAYNENALKTVHIRDAMALAFWSIPKEEPPTLKD